MATTHAKLSASGSSRWLSCTRSPSLEQNYPDKSSRYAEEGSAAHAVAEAALRSRNDADFYLGWFYDPKQEQLIEVRNDIEMDALFDNFSRDELIEVDDDMVEHVQGYIDYVYSLVDEGDILFVEEMLDLSEWIPEGYGTSDIIIYSKKLKKVIVIDLKYGRGVQVFAENNSQAKLYGAGAVKRLEDEYEIEEVELHIYQPRIDHIDVWSIDYFELMMWMDDVVAPKAKLAFHGKGDFNPGEACTWCRAARDCKAFAEYAVSVASTGFTALPGEDDELELKNIELMNAEVIGGLWKHVDILKKWAEQFKKAVRAKLLAGEEIPNLKLVSGRASRFITDEEAAKVDLINTYEITEDELYERKFKSPAQLEKLFGKGNEVLNQYIDSKEPAPTVAHISDKRAALVINPGEGFGQVDDEDDYEE